MDGTGIKVTIISAIMESNLRFKLRLFSSVVEYNFDRDIISHTGGHFDVTKEKRPMDIKKVSVNTCFLFNTRTSSNSEARGRRRGDSHKKGQGYLLYISRVRKKAVSVPLRCSDSKRPQRELFGYVLGD